MKTRFASTALLLPCLLVAACTGAWDSTKNTASNGWDATSSTVEQGWDATAHAAGEGWDATKSLAGKGWEGTKSAASSASDSLKSYGGTVSDLHGYAPGKGSADSAEPAAMQQAAVAPVPLSSREDYAPRRDIEQMLIENGDIKDAGPSR